MPGRLEVLGALPGRLEGCGSLLGEEPLRARLWAMAPAGEQWLVAPAVRRAASDEGSWAKAHVGEQGQLGECAVSRVGE